MNKAFTVSDEALLLGVIGAVCYSFLPVWAAVAVIGILGLGVVAWYMGNITQTVRGFGRVRRNEG